jgi:nucleoid-associated protein YgaU
VTGRKPEDTEITPYWRQVIEVNREGLLSGDPDLIYPGEMVTLPPSDSR